MFEKLSFTKNLIISFISVFCLVCDIKVMAILTVHKIYLSNNLCIFIFLLIILGISIIISLESILTAFDKLK